MKCHSLQALRHGCMNSVTIWWAIPLDWPGRVRTRSSNYKSKDAKSFDGPEVHRLDSLSIFWVSDLTAKVIVLIIFVFAIVFDNAVVGPKMGSNCMMFFRDCGRVLSRRNIRLTRACWACSRKSHEFPEYIHGLSAPLITVFGVQGTEGFLVKVIGPYDLMGMACYKPKNNKNWISSSANWDIRLGVYCQTLQSHHPKLGFEHVWASKKLESSLQMRVSPSKLRLNYVS